MSFFTTSDGVELYYTEHGTGTPIVLSHGWPLNSDAWQLERKLFADAGYRVIAHDRRGHGRSTPTNSGNDIETYAKDLAELVEALDLHDLIVVGHSTGGGEVIKYAAKYGQGRVVKVVTAGGIPPLMLQTEANPEGAPIDVFDGIRQGTASDRAQYFWELSAAFYGTNREGSDISEGVRRDFVRQGLAGDLAAMYDCIRAFSETDQTEDLIALDVPVLLLHGDDDQIVPVQAASEKAIGLLKHGSLKLYPGRPHGIAGSFQTELDQDILDFVRS